MIFGTIFLLTHKPVRVAEIYQAGKDLWDSIFVTEYKSIVDEELDKLDEMESLYPYGEVIGNRLAKVLTDKEKEFHGALPSKISQDAFASIGFLQFYNKYRHGIGDSDYLIRAFRKSDCTFSTQNKAEKFWELVRHGARHGNQGLINLMFETILMLSREPSKVTDVYEEGNRLWGKAYSEQYSVIKKEETGKLMASHAKSYEPQTAERFAEFLPSLEADFKQRCGDELYMEAFAAIGVLLNWDAQKGLTGDFEGSQLREAVMLSQCSDALKEKYSEFGNIARKRGVSEASRF